MGRSAGWETTGQGFGNFKLDDWYLGAVPLCLGLFAVLAAALKKRDDLLLAADADARAEIIFWSVVAVVTLLLSFGKFFPLYSLFYQIPVVNNIRNPVKFMQIFQVAVGILAAYGIQAVLQWRASRTAPAV
jgi:uncharacterized membrane protein YjfL (UPF0719 family)